jgi:tetratricopeptide (TPR) repeat protein
MFLIALSADLGAAARELAVARDILLAAKDSSVLLQYYLNYGVVLCDLGEREAALREFESGRPFLDATTGNLKSAFYLNRGVALAGLNRDAEAIECYREGLQTAGPIHRPTILTNLGNFLHRQGAREEARRRYEEALDARPALSASQEAHVRNNLGRLLFEEGDTTAALENVKRA